MYFVLLKIQMYCPMPIHSFIQSIIHSFASLSAPLWTSWGMTASTVY